MTSLVIYTAIIGGFNDKLRKVIAPRESGGRQVAYVCFTDSVTEQEGDKLGWEVRPPVWRHIDNPRRTARWHKVNSHLALPGINMAMWVDGSHQLKSDPWRMVDRYLKDADMATFRHPERSCVYQEVEACVRLNKDDPAVMKQQVDRYRLAGWPDNNGLFETSVMIRRHMDTVRKFNETWWEEIRQFSLRDQLSVNFSASKVGLRYAHIPGNRAQSPDFYFYSHRT